MKGSKQRGLCPTCLQNNLKSKSEMLHDILKWIKYPKEYYKKGSGELNYYQVLAIYKYILKTKRSVK